MKSTNELVKEWFDIWNNGDFENLPLSDDFKHTSPYGTIDGKEAYMNLIEANKDKFLGNNINMKDEIYLEDRACVRYHISKGDFSMEVSEWLYTDNGTIQHIFSYYNIEGEISEARQLKDMPE